MIRRAVHLALLVSTLVSSQALAQTEESKVTIDIDATSPVAPLEPVWAFFGYDEANYTTTREGRDLLNTLAEAHVTPVHIRTHFLFNSGDGTPSLKWGSTNFYSEDSDGQPIYDYAIIDEIMDATLDAGAFPLFQFGFMPRALSSQPDPYENSGTYVLDGGSFFPPRDYDEWASVVTTWAEHVTKVYAGSQTSWIWELWNEPDIGYWQGTFEEYARLYDHTEAALHGVMPDAQLGGPAVASPEGSFLQEFLRHCATGTNAVTGGEGTRLDMVSFHAKGGVTRVGGSDGYVQMDLGRQLSLHQLGFETVSSSAFAETPIIISEADPDGCAACPSTRARHLDYRNSPAYGAYEVSMMKRSLDLALESDVDLKGVLTWAFTFPETPYFAGYRALATNGIHLPVLNAFKLLGRLRGERLPVTSSGALPLTDVLKSGVRDRPDVDALATVTDDQIQILVWHYHDELREAQPVEVTLDVSVPLPKFERGARVSHQRVDEAHGNAFSVWQSQGSPEVPSSAQLAALREAMNSTTFSRERVVSADDGHVSVAFELPRFGISLLTLEPADAEREDSSGKMAGGCSCRSSAPTRTSAPALFFLLCALGLVRRRGTRSEDWTWN